jgi:phosphate transport system substrate-binding protein
MFRVLLLSCCCYVLSGCSAQKQGEAQPDTATSGAFELVADETLKPAVDSLVFGFNSQTPNAKVTVRYKNATEALDDLLQQRARLVLIARPLGKKERDLLSQQKIELTEADVAENAIGCIVSAKNLLQNISLDSLRAIVQDKDKGVIRVSSSYLSSTEFALDSIFSLDKYQEGRIVRYQTTDSIIERVHKDDHAIGFVSSAWLKKFSNSGDSSIRVLRISGVSDKPIMLHLAYVLQGLYPLTSRICAYTTEVPNTLPRGFLAYAMSADGQRVFLNYDLLPKTQILKLVPSP